MYNTTYHEETNMKPYETLYGQKLPYMVSYLLVTSKVNTDDSFFIVVMSLFTHISLKFNNGLTSHDAVWKPTLVREFIYRKVDRCSLASNLIIRPLIKLKDIKISHESFWPISICSMHWSRGLQISASNTLQYPHSIPCVIFE